MYSLVRPLLFQLEPEKAHALMIWAMRWAGKLPPVRVLLKSWFDSPSKPVKAFGLSFKNPVGLAAGYDKDGTGWRGLASLGFGHIEVGTVTPKPQEGNPQPRIFRLAEDRALINRMGFPGKGAEFVRQQIRRPRPADLILGVNLGKNKNTPLETAVEDYLNLMELFAPLADYLAINVSSPNTTGLRRLQARQALESLLGALARQRELLSVSGVRKIPLLVKLAPDLEENELDQALEAILNTGMDGVIAANTTVGRYSLKSQRANETGGLSGLPLREGSTRMIDKIHRKTNGRLSIIGVGGVMSEVDAHEKLDAGADLIQVFTGLVYAGPGLVKKIIEAI
jgi:dihydroorotate dehydrogenase